MSVILRVTREEFSELHERAVLLNDSFGMDRWEEYLVQKFEDRCPQIAVALHDRIRIEIEVAVEDSE